MANQIVKLKKGSDYLYPIPSGTSIDTTDNLLEINDYYQQQSPPTHTFNATKDCFAFVIKHYTNAYGRMTITINGNNLYDYAYSSSYDTTYTSFPIKQGDVVTFRGSIMKVKVFGIKY